MYERARKVAQGERIPEKSPRYNTTGLFPLAIIYVLKIFYYVYNETAAYPAIHCAVVIHGL